MSKEENRILHPPGWPRPRGYANGIVASGSTIFLSGMVGWSAEGVLVSPDFVEQASQALRNIIAVLAEAGGRPENVVRLTWYVLDKSEYLNSYKELGVAYREVMGHHFPAMTAVEVKGLMPQGARLEIEATAVLPR